MVVAAASDEDPILKKEQIQSPVVTSPPTTSSGGQTRSESVPSSSKGTQKVVTFGRMMQFREYPIIVGDNPAVTRGVPIQIGWEYMPQYQLSLDEYERFREGRRRLKFELQLESLDRVRMLKASGYSVDEIRKGIRLANVGRMQRQRTRELLHFTPIQESWERFKRSVLNVTIRYSQKRQERALLNQYRSTSSSSSSLSSLCQTKMMQDESTTSKTVATDPSSHNSVIHHEYAKGKFLKVD